MKKRFTVFNAYPVKSVLFFFFIGMVGTVPVIGQTPASEDFDAAGFQNVTATSLVVGDWTFAATAAMNIATPNQSESPQNTNVDGGAGDRCLFMNYTGNSITTFNIYSTSGVEFQLNSFDMGAVGGGATSLTIAGKRDGVVVVPAESVDLTASDATGNITYAFAATTAGGSYGTLSFGTAFSNIDEIELVFTGPGIPELDNLNVSAAVALPVTLLNFGAQPQEASIVLNWETAGEVDFSHFVVEKSTDGLLFNEAGKVAAAAVASNYKQSYTWTDEQISASVVYYRLKMVDIDGKFVYSETVQAKYSGTDSRVILVSPTVITSFVNLSLNIPETGVFKVTVTDISGHLQLSRQLQVQEGFSTQKVDGLGVLKPGLYVLQLSYQQEKYTYKLIKQ